MRSVKNLRLNRVASQFQRFIQLESFGGILLLVSAVAALVWANSPWGSTYDSFWGTPVTVGVGAHTMTITFAHIVNDGLMVIFFFIVGLEIKRELLVGELCERRKAMLPIVAAVAEWLFPRCFFGC